MPGTIFGILKVTVSVVKVGGVIVTWTLSSFTLTKSILTEMGFLGFSEAKAGLQAIIKIARPKDLKIFFTFYLLFEILLFSYKYLLLQKKSLLNLYTYYITC